MIPIYKDWKKCPLHGTNQWPWDYESDASIISATELCDIMEKFYHIIIYEEENLQIQCKYLYEKMMNFNLLAYLVVLTGLKNDRNIYILWGIKNDRYLHSLSDRNI